MTDKPIPLWQKTTAIIYVAGTIVVLIVFRGRLGADFWPLDASRIAPNIVATVVQLAIATPAAILLWPPTRRRIHAFVDRHTEAIHRRLDKQEELHQETIRHLQHIIKHHPDIPPL